MSVSQPADVAAPLLVLIPEFPGQTHNFFWREVLELEHRGVPVCLVSTRRPPPRLVSPAWAAEAIARTTYLMPMSPGAIWSCLASVLVAGPGAWWRCARLVTAPGIGGWALRLRLAALALVAGRLRSLAQAAGARHVHIHSCADAANIALFAHALGGPSYSLTLHGALGGYGPNQPAKWGNAAFALVVSRTLHDAVQRSLAGHLPARLEIAPMGVDLAFFQRASPYSAWGGSGPLRLFSCARLNRHKGHATSVAMLQDMVAQGIDATLVIAGEDDQGGAGYRRELEERIAAAGMSARVTLLGAVNANCVRDHLEQAHAFVLLSEDEALGVAYMEAMAMEVPVLGCRVGGVPELIEDGRHGRLVPPADAVVARQVLLEMLASPSAAVQMAREARAQVEANFGSNRSAEKLLDCMIEIQAGRRGVSAKISA